MKKIFVILLLFLVFPGCKDREITEADRKIIVEELEAIKELDQAYAGIPPQEMMEKYGNRKAWEVFLKMRDSVGLINQNRIKDLFEEYGFLGYKQVGRIASGHFWVVVQHADNDIDFQQAVLREMEDEIELGNAEKSQFAMLEDRININLGKPQRFGTQVTYNDSGQAIPKIGLVDSARIEELRAEYELPSFKDYYNQMTIGHFEMNRQALMEKGITAPVLYQ